MKSRKRRAPPHALSPQAKIVLQSAQGAGKKIAGEVVRLAALEAKIKKEMIAVTAIPLAMLLGRKQTIDR